MGPGCLFCKIISGEIPCCKVLENKKVLAFLDINPAGTLHGHTLVMPKKHFEGICDCPEEELKAVIAAAKTVACAVKTVSGAEGINVTLNDGRAAGQLVNHIHFHIIPRARGDGIRFNENRRKPKPMELVETAESIRKELEKQK